MINFHDQRHEWFRIWLLGILLQATTEGRALELAEEPRNVSQKRFDRTNSIDNTLSFILNGSPLSKKLYTHKGRRIFNKIIYESGPNENNKSFKPKVNKRQARHVRDKYFEIKSVRKLTVVFVTIYVTILVSITLMALSVCYFFRTMRSISRNRRRFRGFHYSPLPSSVDEVYQTAIVDDGRKKLSSSVTKFHRKSRSKYDTAAKNDLETNSCPSSKITTQVEVHKTNSGTPVQTNSDIKRKLKLAEMLENTSIHTARSLEPRLTYHPFTSENLAYDSASLLSSTASKDWMRNPLDWDYENDNVQTDSLVISNTATDSASKAKLNSNKHKCCDGTRTCKHFIRSQNSVAFPTSFEKSLKSKETSLFKGSSHKKEPRIGKSVRSKFKKILAKT